VLPDPTDEPLATEPLDVPEAVEDPLVAEPLDGAPLVATDDEPLEREPLVAPGAADEPLLTDPDETTDPLTPCPPVSGDPTPPWSELAMSTPLGTPSRPTTPVEQPQTTVPTSTTCPKGDQNPIDPYCARSRPGAVIKREGRSSFYPTPVP
jgi:hypothetical protein